MIKPAAILFIIACACAAFGQSPAMPAAVPAPASRTIPVAFNPVQTWFTNFEAVLSSSTNFWRTNAAGIIYRTNITTTITTTELLALKPVTNYLFTLTPGTNFNTAFTNVASPLRVITNTSPARITVPFMATQYIANGWALLADGQRMWLGADRFPSAPTNVLHLRAWLVASDSLTGTNPWSRQTLLGGTALTNAGGRQRFFAVELEEQQTDFTPRFLTLSRNTFKQP